MIAALFVGLCFGFTAYHFFVAPYLLKQGLHKGMLMAAADIKEWLESVAPEFKEQVQGSMHEFNMNRKMAALLKQIAAADVAREEKKK